MGGALGPGISRFDKENVSYFSEDLEGPQISENGPDSPEPKDEQISHIRGRVKRAQIKENGRGASGPGMRRFDKENVSYFSKDLEEPQIRENGPGSLEPQDELI
jgi:hypothetical protein